MQIYNSLTEKKENIDTKKPIGIYVCGITPYDAAHLGHAFTFITYDILIRNLRFQKIKTTYVQNVTDIDDDILERAKKIGTDWRKLAKEETKKYTKDMDSLNILGPDFFPYATEHIGEMIKIIEVLINKNFAYIKNGSVYFDIKKYKKFGQLSKFNYQAMLQIGDERGNFPLDPNKKDLLDFVLWQAKKPGEPYWESPWGQGRPGWHIECSAMSMRYLGSEVTIHGGGNDLIFPHHEAEIAQSENYTGEKFVKHWMHVAMVYCGGRKMSKSLGNMIFVRDLLKKYPPNAIRIFLLLHHYRKPWNYEEKEIVKAEKLANLFEKKAKEAVGDISDEELKKKAHAFLRALDNDLNTPQAIAILEDLANRNGYEDVVYSCSQILGLKLNKQ